MSGYQTARQGVYSATLPTDLWLLKLPKLWRGDGTVYPVILHHSATSQPWQYSDVGFGFPDLVYLAETIVRDFGRPVFAPWLIGDKWGNDTAIAATDDAVNSLPSMIGSKSGAAHLLGTSMGGGACFAYTRAHPTKVKSITGLLPMCDLTDIFVNNRLGQAASINAAYGGAYSEGTYGATHNPVTFASQLAGIPIQILASTDDTAVIPSTVTAFATGVGSSCQVTWTTGSHGEGALSTITTLQRQALCDFIRRHS